MKSNPLNRSYIILAGIVVVMLALVIYMWMDARRIQRSLAKGPEPLPEMVKSSPAQAVDAGTNIPPIMRDLPSRPQRNRLKPGEIVTGNKGLEPPPQKGPPPREEIARENRKDMRRTRDGAATGADDWMFETGKKVIEEEEMAESEALIPE